MDLDLSRKLHLSWVRPLSRRRSRRLRGRCGLAGSGGGGCLRLGVGFAAEGDFVAHGVQGADEAAEPAGGLALVVVPARAEVVTASPEFPAPPM